MKDNISLITELIEQAKTIDYYNDNQDSVHRRAVMLFRKFFGEKSHYINELNNISYTPFIFSTNSPDALFINSFNSGKKKLLNLLNVVLEDLQLHDETITTKENKTSSENSKLKVFIVHGHNEEMKLNSARVVEKLRLEPIILHEQPNQGKTIIEKFTHNSEVAFAIVLFSADDIGNSKDLPESPRFRARQNVILELGFFIGKLGRERVVALFETKNNIEIPSDYYGVVFIEYDTQGKWKLELVREMKACGINVDANDLIE